MPGWLGRRTGSPPALSRTRRDRAAGRLIRRPFGLTEAPWKAYRCGRSVRRSGPRGRSIIDPTAAFFDDLAAHSRQPLLARTHGTVRFDIADGDRTDHYLLAIDDGMLTVSRTADEADCVVAAQKTAFDEVAAGQTNPMSALLRGALTVSTGDPRLLVRVQRLFPAPTQMPTSTGPRSMGKRRS